MEYKPSNFYSFKHYHLKKGLTIDEIKELYDKKNAERKHCLETKGVSKGYDRDYKKQVCKDYYQLKKNDEHYLTTKYNCMMRMAEKKLSKLKEQSQVHQIIV